MAQPSIESITRIHGRINNAQSTFKTKKKKKTNLAMSTNLAIASSQSPENATDKNDTDKNDTQYNERPKTLNNRQQNSHATWSSAW
jgi:hypothetical protein